MASVTVDVQHVYNNWAIVCFGVQSAAVEGERRNNGGYERLDPSDRVPVRNPDSPNHYEGLGRIQALVDTQLQEERPVAKPQM